MIISKNIQDNITIIEDRFDKCDDVVHKRFDFVRNGQEVSFYILYIDGLCDNNMIEDTIIHPLTWEWSFKEKDICDLDKKNGQWSFFNEIEKMQAETAELSVVEDLDQVIKAAMDGDTGILVSDSQKAFTVSSKKLPVRSIEESAMEGGMRGARDSFNESIRTSTALIRRRIKDYRLKVEQGIIGERSKSSYGVMYIQDIAKKELVEKVKSKLCEYEIDAIFDSGMAEHLMEEKWYKLFPIFQSTTRPDKAAAALTEGRVVIVFDNSPEVLIAPATVNTLFQTSDDYYNRYMVASFARVIRYLAAFIAAFLPGFYVAVTAFHREIIPDKLLYAIADSRSQLSFPIVVEVLVMELLFELLREAGIRLPSQMGNTIGVVGGLIVGQSAVEAGIVSTMVVIIVALTAIASFAIPNEVFASVFRLLKFVAILAAAVWGIYGYFIVILTVFFCLAKKDSFGEPYLSPVVSFSKNTAYENKDFIVRFPITFLRYRPKWSSVSQRRRLKKKQEGEQ